MVAPEVDVHLGTQSFVEEVAMVVSARNSSSFSYKRLVPTRGIELGVGSIEHIVDLQVKA